MRKTALLIANDYVGLEAVKEYLIEHGANGTDNVTQGMINSYKDEKKIHNTKNFIDRYEQRLVSIFSGSDETKKLITKLKQLLEKTPICAPIIQNTIQQFLHLQLDTLPEDGYKKSRAIRLLKEYQLVTVEELEINPKNQEEFRFFKSKVAQPRNDLIFAVLDNFIESNKEINTAWNDIERSCPIIPANSSRTAFTVDNEIKLMIEDLRKEINTHPLQQNQPSPEWYATLEARCTNSSSLVNKQSNMIRLLGIVENDQDKMTTLSSFYQKCNDYLEKGVNINHRPSLPQNY